MINLRSACRSRIERVSGKSGSDARQKASSDHRITSSARNGSLIHYVVKRGHTPKIAQLKLDD